jgi:hypothetical protein
MQKLPNRVFTSVTPSELQHLFRICSAGHVCGALLMLSPSDDSEYYRDARDESGVPYDDGGDYFYYNY